MLSEVLCIGGGEEKSEHLFAVSLAAVKCCSERDKSKFGCAVLKQEERRSKFGSEVLQREEQPVSLEVTCCSERRSKLGSDVLQREEK